MPSIRQRLRYRFDNLMARGTGAQILLLAVITAVLVLIAAVATEALVDLPDDPQAQHAGFPWLAWKSLNHALDAGMVGGEDGTWTFLIIMMGVTIGGLFVLSALIGILNNGFSALIESLRRGRSTVIERNHTVILGWSPKIHTLLSEFAAAGANQRNACVVVMASRDKVTMDADVAESLAGKRLRVVTRAGSPMNIGDLDLVSLATAKAIVVLAPETHPDGREMAPHESDTVVLKTLLAINKVGGKLPLHVVAEIFDERTETVARMVVGPSAALIVAPPLISRLLVQTGRQSGLSVVYTELLDFGGVEMYVKPEPALTGQTFRDAVFAYDDSALLGVVTAEGQTLVPPPLDRRFAPGDQVIVISEDDDTAILNGKPVAVPAGAIVAAPRRSDRHRERTLVLGGSARLGRVLAELDAYVAPGSETMVFGDGEALTAAGDLNARLTNMRVTPYVGDTTDRGLLDKLGVANFDHILVLSETSGRSQEMADARTMITLLHLRDLARVTGKQIPITSEILEIENRDLAAVAEADDFIVSNTLVSLLVSQVAENRHLVKVFEELFTAGGHEIYLKPASEYVALGIDVPYQAVVDAGLRRNEVAIGFRLAATARDAGASYGVTVSPKKSQAQRFAPGDKIIVLADE